MPTLTELHLYPIKSCAGISLREATLTTAGLMSERIYDREWMVVDEHGEFISQREYPRMALITPRIRAETLELRAPGMLNIEIPLGLADPHDAPTINVQIWNDKVQAYDCDETTATWFSRFLGTPCRLVRFHPHAQRKADAGWTEGIDAPTLFSDGFPLLVVSEASLADLNKKLLAQDRPALTMNRFRPNLVIDGVDAFEEDYAEALRIGGTTVKPVKPCARCSIPSVDQSSGERADDPLDVLQTYRVNPKVDGGITFGMNAVVTAGDGVVLRVGDAVTVDIAF